MTNLLQALHNIVDNPIVDIVSYYRSKNKINAIGDALENFVKDVFAGTLSESNESIKNQVYQELFSYFGNQNNPPDLMIVEGDAIEIKKIESDKSQIALNSSYPAAKLYADSTLINQACKTCESWREKDIIYTIGCVKNNKLHSLWFVYGDCYAASREVYEKIKSNIKKGVLEIKDVEFTQTKELGRVNRVDPLGITYLRIRGMWGIENPIKVFNYLNIGYSTEYKLQVFALMKTDKYLSFPLGDRQKIESLASSSFKIKDVEIKSPDNPVKLIPAKLLTYQL